MQYSSTCQVAAAGAAAKNFNYFIFFEKNLKIGVSSVFENVLK